MATQQLSMKLNSQTSTYSLEGFLAKHSLWQESFEDLTTQEVHCFLKSQGFFKTKNQDILYSKMYEVYYLMTLEELSRQSLGFLPTWAMELNGRYLTAKITQSPKTERGCLLSDILETEVPEKYFLSQKMSEKLLSSQGKISHTH